MTITAAESGAKLDGIKDAADKTANGGKTERPMDWASALDSIQ